MRTRWGAWFRVRGRRWLFRYGTVAIIMILVGAYIGLIALYGVNHGGSSRAEILSASDITMVTLELENIEANYSSVTANVLISPGVELLDPRTNRLKDELRFRVRSALAPTNQRTWTRDMLPGVFPVSLTLAGQTQNWPLDSYRTGPIEIELWQGAVAVPERPQVTFVNQIPGWKVQVSAANVGLGANRLTLARSPSTVVFATVVVGVLVLIASLGVFVAVQTIRRRRRFQPPMTTWYAAMLFSVVPLRNALPGSPPFGGWIDITVVLAVIVLLVLSMLLYIASWWRHLEPMELGEAHRGSDRTP